MRLRWSDVLASVIAGLLLGAIVHIAIVLRIPVVAREDAFARLALAGADGAATPIPPGLSRAGAMGDDPLTPRSACAWNLTDGPMRIILPSSGLPQTLSIHDRAGRVIYSLTDRAAVRGQMALVLMTEAQREERQLIQSDDAEDDDLIEVVSPTLKGLVIVRAVPASPAWRDRAVAATTSVTCRAED